MSFHVNLYPESKFDLFSDLQDELNKLVGDNNSSCMLAVTTLNRGKTNSVALENVGPSYSCRHVIL